MKSYPPALAMWLLKRLGSGPNADAISGDLLERFQERRSDGWYWRQVVIALLVGSWQEIRTHKLLVARAICIGTVASFLLYLAQLTLGSLLIPQWLWTSPAFRFAILSLNYPRAMLTGWIVGRLHRPHGFPQVLAFLLWWLLWNAPRISALVVNSFDHERYGPYLVGAIEMTTLTALCIVLGGFLSIGKPSRERTETAEQS
jgi:hypothetical protein